MYAWCYVLKICYLLFSNVLFNCSILVIVDFRISYHLWLNSVFVLVILLLVIFRLTWRICAFWIIYNGPNPTIPTRTTMHVKLARSYTYLESLYSLRVHLRVCVRMVLLQQHDWSTQVVPCSLDKSRLEYLALRIHDTYNSLCTRLCPRVGCAIITGARVRPHTTLAMANIPQRDGGAAQIWCGATIYVDDAECIASITRNVRKHIKSDLRHDREMFFC